MLQTCYETQRKEIDSISRWKFQILTLPNRFHDTDSV